MCDQSIARAAPRPSRAPTPPSTLTAALPVCVATAVSVDVFCGAEILEPVDVVPEPLWPSRSGGVVEALLPLEAGVVVGAGVSGGLVVGTAGTTEGGVRLEVSTGGGIGSVVAGVAGGATGTAGGVVVGLVLALVVLLVTAQSQ